MLPCAIWKRWIVEFMRLVNSYNTRTNSRCFTTLAKLKDWVFVSLKIRGFYVHGVRFAVWFVLMMRDRHLISNTHIYHRITLLFPLGKRRYHKNLVDKLTKCSETILGVRKYSILNVSHMSHWASLAKTINVSPPYVAYMRQWTGSTLLQLTACRLFGAKPLPEPMVTFNQLDP